MSELKWETVAEAERPFGSGCYYPDILQRVKVEGGWIYRNIYLGKITMTFVPAGEYK